MKRIKAAARRMGWLIAAFHAAHWRYFEWAAQELRAGSDLWGQIIRRVRAEMQRALDDSGLPDDVQNDFVTRDKR